MSYREPSIESTSTELQVITDTVDQQRARVASLAEPFLGSDRDDIVNSVYEAERQLLVSVRALQRAIKTLDRA